MQILWFVVSDVPLLNWCLSDSPVRYPRTIHSSGITSAFFTNIALPSNWSLYFLTSCGIWSTSAVTKWFGKSNFENQKHEICVNSFPLSGIPYALQITSIYTDSHIKAIFIGRTLRKITSYADIRSVATKSKWSGEEVVKISRTLPFESKSKPGRSVLMRADIFVLSKVPIGLDEENRMWQSRDPWVENDSLRATQN